MGQRHDFIALSLIFSHLSIVRCVNENQPAPDPVLVRLVDLLVPNSTRNITCLSSRTDLSWNIRDEQYDGRSLQLLCADPLFGGPTDNYRPNFRGYCQDGDVFFGPRNLLHKSNNRYERSLLECRTRCFCNGNLPDLSQQPKDVATTRRTWRSEMDTMANTISVDRQGHVQGRFTNQITRLYFYELLLVEVYRCGHSSIQPD